MNRKYPPTRAMRNQAAADRLRAGLAEASDGGFRCVHCRQFVSTNPLLSGVNNRNHCPYCLRSRHLDLYIAGDRLAACKEKMHPVGLTVKQTRKKYGADQSGELMLIHRCSDCNKLSINRIAADDDPATLFGLFKGSLKLDAETRVQLAENGIQPLGLGDANLVLIRLFGNGAQLPKQLGEAFSVS